MSAVPFPQRVVRAVGRAPVSERISRAQEAVYGPVIGWAARSPLHTDRLGHSLHPPLTDLTVGCWTSASLLDLAGGAGSRRAATLLVAAGVVAAAPTAIAGAGDWAGTTGDDRRVGAVHALGTDAATVLQLLSLVARLRGRTGAGVALGVTGTLVATGAGLLGSHLALSRGLARRASPRHRQP